VTTPSWIPDTFAAIMILVAAVSAARLAAAGRAGRWWVSADADSDAAHLLMAVAMAGMLVAGLRTLPAVAWEVVFALMTVWFTGRVAREERGRGLRSWVSSCHSPHLVHSAAMCYMFAAVITPRAAAGPEPYGKITVETRQEIPRDGMPRLRAVVTTPRLATICRIAMGVTMAYMLVIMI
jgi:hypothetical protein